MRKYWLKTKDFCTMVTVPKNNFRTFIHATLSMVPRDKDNKMLNLLSSDGERHNSSEAHGAEPMEVKAKQEQCFLKEEKKVDGDIL